MRDNRIDKKGLSTQEAEASRLKNGSNQLSEPKKQSLWLKFFEKFADPIIVILLIAMALSFAVAAYHYTQGGEGFAVFLEPLGVLFAILLATGVAFYFDLKVEQEFELINKLNAEVPYKVYRDGSLQELMRSEIVVGDLVYLDFGEEVPADGQIVECLSLLVDESSLTGEPSTLKGLGEELKNQEHTYPADCLYRGSKILEGNVYFQVTAVGDSTEYGKIFKGAQLEDDLQTPLNKQLDDLANLITQVSYVIAGLVLLGSALIYYLNGSFETLDWSHLLSFFLNKIMIAVTVIVVAVPEGLPMSVTLSLAYSMRSMMKSNNFVRRMHACETMGATTVICTDKTGTLTQNQMNVAEHYDRKGGAEEDAPSIYLALAVNSTAHLGCDVQGKECVLGNPTEGALLLWLEQMMQGASNNELSEGFHYQGLRDDNPILERLDFSTERKYMASLIQYGERRLLLVKGAPEIVLNYCDVSAEEKADYLNKLAEYQTKAMRTIACAYLYIDDNRAVFDKGTLAVDKLKFSMIFAISDPIRTEVPLAIEECQMAGIKVKIVTGDTSGTAKEIGRQIGLWTPECAEAQHISGDEFTALSDEELMPRLSDLRIISRAKPMDKERLVRLLQKAGEVVAVTGDGTNDAPALNKAHVGLSMGDGTAVAKEASDITILDNSFNSISQAVMWGRSLHLNIQRFILFQMTINVAACLIVLIGSFLGTESPLTVTQMLWVNLIMDTFAALALASLPPSKKLMKEQPRKQEEAIISRPMLKRIIGQGLFFVVLLFGLLQYFKHYDLTSLSDFNLMDMFASFFDFTKSGAELSLYELTLFFGIFVFLQFWNMFNAKAFFSGCSAFYQLGQCRNFLLIALIILLGQVLITTFGGDMFRLMPLDLMTWLVLLLLTSPVLFIGELVRFISNTTK